MPHNWWPHAPVTMDPTMIPEEILPLLIFFYQTFGPGNKKTGIQAGNREEISASKGLLVG